MNFESLAEDRQLDLQVDIPKDLPSVLGDEDLVQQALINYITNAIRFTQEGGKIVVKTVKQKEEVHVHVIDTGIGIESEELPKVWKRFYKINNSRTLSKEGAGLDLSLVKEIMERLDGRAWVESALGKGSTFSFALRVTKK